MEFKPIHFRTPLLHSSILSKQAGCHVYLKLDNTQPSGSFKTRGLGNIAQLSYAQFGSKTHFVCSSGGNAGVAAAYAASVLGTSCTVFVPLTAKMAVIERIKGLNATVIQGGIDWQAADYRAKKFVGEVEGRVYLPPFDHPLVVDGNATIIKEVKEQLIEQGETRTMDAISVSVGGGGLLAGILQGIERECSADNPVAVIAAETYGAASLALSLHASYKSTQPEARLERLDKISTICNSLGATQVSSDALSFSLEHRGGVTSLLMTDKVALDNVRPFANAHSFLLEPACTASLTPIYYPSVLRLALPSILFSLEPGSSPRRFDNTIPVVVILICGGSTMSLEEFEIWEQEFGVLERGEIRLFNGEISREDIVLQV